MLLVSIEEAVESIGAQINGFGDQASKEDADLAHALHVVFKYRSKVWQGLLIRPLVGTEQITVERIILRW